MDCNAVNVLQFDYIIPSLSGLAAISLIYPTYIYIKSYVRDQFQTSKWLFYLGNIFFISIILCYVNHAIASPFLCHNKRLFESIRAPLFYLYIIQGVALLIILFQRLVFIFQNKKVSKLHISKCTIRMFYSLFILVITLSIIGTQFYLSSSEQYIILGVYIRISAGFDYIFLILWLNSLFIYKLCRVYTKNDGDDDDKLLDMTIKTAILCGISTLFTCIYLIGRYLHFAKIGIFEPLDFYFINGFILVADLHTNYLSVLLSYNYFNNWYFSICIYCHSGCTICWNCCFDERIKRARMMRQAVATSSTQSTPVGTKATPQATPLPHSEIAFEIEMEL